MAEGGVVKLEATPIQQGGANQAPTEESDIIRRSIVYIVTPDKSGTGSIVKFGDNSYLMTCNHVIPTEEMARKTSIFFDKILQTGDKKSKNKGIEVKGQKLFSFKSDRWFLTSSEDVSEFDVTLIAIKMNKVPNLSKSKHRRQLDLSEYKEHLPEYSLKVNDGVKIWHYPENDKFRRNESFYTVNSVSGHLFTHSAGTDHGSSGAPVFKICKGKEVAKEVVVGLHRGSLKNHSNPPDLNLATRIQAIRCMLSDKEQALEDVDLDVLCCQKGSSKEGSSEAPAKSESSDQDLQRPGDSVSQHSLPSTGQPNQEDQQTMPPSTTPVEDRRTLALSKAHEKLKKFYTKRAKCRKQFINLALVGRPPKVDKTKKCAKAFIKEVADGIDQYTKKEKNIEYKDILTSTDSDSGKRVLINGPPGSGKTTLAEQLCRDLYSGDLPNQYQLVLFAKLKAFKVFTTTENKKASLLTLLEYLGLPETDSLCSMIKQGEGRGVAIILDGYDEISDPSYKTLAEWVSEVFCDECLAVSECDVFITTRPSQLSQLAKVASVHMEILGFSSNDIECFIKAYDFKGPSDKAEEVIRRLTDLPLVRGLCRNPKVLDIACNILKHQDEEHLPPNLSGIFLRYVCYQLEDDLKEREDDLKQREDDLKQREPPVKTRIMDLLSVPKDLFPGFYPLCSLAYHCCLNQQLVLEIQDLQDMKIVKYINKRGSVYKLLFGEDVDSPSAISCMLYQCDHKTVMEALAAVHIALLSKEEQKQMWDKWFTAPHMAQVWMMYCGLTGLKSVDLTRLCSLTIRSKEVAKGWNLDADAFEDEDKLVMVSLFEAGNDEKAKCVLPVLLKSAIQGDVRSQHDVLCLAYSIYHHPDLSIVRLRLPDDCSELDLKRLTTSLKNVEAVELKCDRIEPMLTVLPRAVVDLSLDFSSGTSYKGLGDALRDCHNLRSLTINITTDSAALWIELGSAGINRKLTEFHLKGHLAPPPMETLKNLLFHQLEKCSLEIALNDHQLSALLVGLKRADKLKELDLSMKILSSKVNSNQWLVTFPEVVELVSTHPHLVKVDVKNTKYTFDEYRIVPLLKAVAIGAIKNKNVTQLGLGGFEIREAPIRLGLPFAYHITSIRAEYFTMIIYGGDDDAWSKDVIAGPMARRTCFLRLVGFSCFSLALLLSRVNRATKLKDLSLEIDGGFKGYHKKLEDSDVHAVKTAFTNCNLRKLRIKFNRALGQCRRLHTAIVNGLAANTTTQVDSCICSNYCQEKKITRHLSQQAQQRFEVVKTSQLPFFIISRDPSVLASDPLLNTPSQPTSPKSVTTPPETPKPVTTPPETPEPVTTPPETPKPVTTPPDPSPSTYLQCPAGPTAPRTGMDEKIARSLDILGVPEYREGLIDEMKSLGAVLGIEEDTNAILSTPGTLNTHLLEILGLYIKQKTPTWKDFCKALKRLACFNKVRAKIEADHDKSVETHTQC